MNLNKKTSIHVEKYTVKNRLFYRKRLRISAYAVINGCPFIQLRVNFCSCIAACVYMRTKIYT